ITYLLSLCEHGDLHLRGACASLLATLIQTTIHLLLNNVHLYQLIHKTVQGIKLLEDSIQHTTSSYILAKISLAQFIDDIDFRILTYLEQQQKQLKQYILIYVFVKQLLRLLLNLSNLSKRKNVLKVAQMIQNQTLLDIYSTQLTLFDVVSSVALRSIDPFVIAFRALNDVLLSVDGTRDETFSADTCTYVHNLFGLIHHTSVASHLFVCEGIHLYESGLTLVLLIEQFLPLSLNKQL
ncbi:unnamed protein product, partial [Rotaria sp. Silwood1]